MNSLEVGRYLIKVALRPGQPFVGGTNFGGPPVVHVVVGGRNNAWTVLRAPEGHGNYILSLQEDNRYAQEDHGNVVATTHNPQAPSIWHIRPQRDGLFTIEVPNESKGWSLYDTNVNAYVAVGYIGGTPEQGQLWEFIPHRED